MAELDPAIARRFAWTGNYTFQQVLADPQINARFQASYDIDPTYQPPDCDVQDLQIPGPAGVGPVSVRIYTPTRTVPTAALVWAHGGGWVGGSLDMREADGVARELATRAQALVVSVGYRLANGQDITYPRLHQEVAAAFTWTLEQVAQLGIDPTHVQLGGASAGASLALSATLQAIAEHQPLPARLQLLYPLVHRTIPSSDTRHLDQLPALLRLQQPTVNQLLAAYLGPSEPAPYFEVGNNNHPALPPTLIVVSEYDELRPSGEHLARHIQSTGGNVTLYLAEGTIHGHLSLSATTTETERTLQLMADHLGR